MHVRESRIENSNATIRKRAKITENKRKSHTIYRDMLCFFYSI